MAIARSARLYGNTTVDRRQAVDDQQYSDFRSAEKAVLHVLEEVQGQSLTPAQVISQVAGMQDATEFTIKEAIWHLLSLQKIEFNADFQLKRT